MDTQRKRAGAIVAGMAVLGISSLAGAQHRPQGASPWENDVLQHLFDSRQHWVPVDGAGPGVLAAANHVIGRQCTDGGWGWPHELCPTTTFNNITGPIALGLLRAWEVTGDAGVLAAAVDAGDFDMAFTYPNTEPRFSSYAPAFLRLLAAASGNPAYSSHVETEFFDELTAATYGPSDLSTHGWIAALQAARSGTLINLRPWDLHNLPWVAAQIGNADSTTPADGVPQSTAFENSVLSGLNTLDEGLQYDLLGLAGGIRGLALNGTTSFTAIVAPLFDDIDGISGLCDLADVLVTFQNSDGSWSWRSDLQNPVDPTDKDTQTTAYAVLALIAADEAGCVPVPGGRYNDEIAAGREFLDSMQDVDGGFFSYPTGDHNIEAEAEALHAMAVAPLSLSTSACETSGTLTVTIDMATMPVNVVGGQFFLEYDDSVLTFVSADPGSLPFEIEVFESTAPGTISYAVGVDGGGPGTSVATTMATLTFSVDVEVCTPTAALVSFDRAHTPPTRLTDAVGNAVLPTLADLNEVTLDETGPDITPPLEVVVNADAGACLEAVVTVPPLDADDTCSGIASVVNDYNDTDNATDTYLVGTTVVTWTVTDNCGNVSIATQDITVDDENDLILAVDLESVVAPSVERCITLELYDCPLAAPIETVEVSLTFTAGSFTGTVEIPCGEYTCMTARDSLHTLSRTDLDDFAILGTAYVSDFTGSSGELIGGNLNDDTFIDILDFGILVGQFGDIVGADTACPTPAGPHADISGNGTVFSEDYTYISLHFLEENEDPCCSLSPASAANPWQLDAGPRPVVRISVGALRRLGMQDLVVADLNADGWLDVLDMVEFSLGARP